MFVLNRHFLTITKYTKILYKNAIQVDKHSLNVLQQNVFKQLTRNHSSEITNKVTLQETDDPANGIPVEKSGETDFVNYDIITKGNKELEHKLKVIMLEAEVLRQEGHSIPESHYMKPDMWEILLNSPSRTSRKKYLEYLFKVSKKKENSLYKKLERRKITEEYKRSLPSQELEGLPIEEHAFEYRLNRNCMLLRVHDATMNHFFNNKLLQAMQFGQKIVIDCGYDENMTRRENYNCAKQLMLLFADNRTSNQPFDINFANVNREGDMIKMLHKYIPTMYEPEFPMNINDKSYLELFPKKKLVYLTPHCREEMDYYDADAVYIIGALVDKDNNEPLSLARAKREGITMKKFPLDKFLQWGSGSGKSLTINQCVSILLDIKDTGDWNYALRHVPKRKLGDTRTNYHFGKDRDNYRFNSNEQRSWKPNYFKRPSYMKNDS